MNSTLIIFSQGPLAGQSLLEALSASLVIATFGIPVTFCFQGDAIQLLKKTSRKSPTDTLAFKSAQAMIESFEFYDVLPVWISPEGLSADQQYREKQLQNIEIEHEVRPLDANTLASFQRVIYW